MNLLNSTLPRYEDGDFLKGWTKLQDFYEPTNIQYHIVLLQKIYTLKIQDVKDVDKWIRMVENTFRKLEEKWNLTRTDEEVLFTLYKKNIPNKKIEMIKTMF